MTIRSFVIHIVAGGRTQLSPNTLDIARWAVLWRLRDTHCSFKLALRFGDRWQNSGFLPFGRLMVLNPLSQLEGGSESAFSHEFIRQLVAIVGGSRKVLCQNLAATIDRLAKTITAVARFQTLGDRVDDFIPGPGLNFLIDAAVGEHDYPVFQKRGENQDSRMRFRVMEAVTRESRQAARLNRIRDPIL